MRRLIIAASLSSLSALSGAGCSPAEAERPHVVAAAQPLSETQAQAILSDALNGSIASFPAQPSGFGDYPGPMIYPARIAERRASRHFEQSVHFYRDALGLEEIPAATGDQLGGASSDGAPLAARPAKAAKAVQTERRYFGDENGHFAVVRVGAEVTVTASPPSEAVGWGVRDIERVASALEARGVTPIRFEGAAHRPNGVWTAPNGDQVLWFADPDGYPLAVVQQKPF